VRPKIRDEIWVKLWGNLSFNPISALTHADARRPLHRPRHARRRPRDDVEAQAVAEALA
jgi:2-dehydropantoate 2-reductase